MVVALAVKVAQSLIVDVGAPIILQVTKKIKWPLAIGVLDGDAMVVRYSTMPYSPLAVQATTLGHRLGLLESAMGLAYLAFCDDDERTILLNMLRTASPKGNFADDDDVNVALRSLLFAGYRPINESDPDSRKQMLKR